MIKHVSFDLWGTLIKSNPLFKSERINFIHKYYNPANTDLESVKYVVEHVDVMCNTINEGTGKNISSVEMYAMILHYLGCSFNDDTLKLLKRESDKLFIKHLPTLFDDVEYVLKSLRMNNVTVSVLSNTGFIEGETVKLVLNLLGVGKYIDFCIFSDEEGLSKPNPKIFDRMYHNACYRKLHRREVLHVGDSKKADINGAMTMGLKTMQINSNSKTIKNVLNEVLRITQHSQPV